MDPDQPSASPSNPSFPLRLPAASRSDTSNATVLSGSDDLLSRFELSPVYDVFVRPYLAIPSTGDPSHSSSKGKEPEKAANYLYNSSTAVPPPPATHGGKAKSSFTDKKPSSLRPEKRFHEWIPDVGGYCPPRPDRDPQRQSLTSLFRPDYVPPPPIDANSVDDDQIRNAFGGFSKGDLEGWDQSVWETTGAPHQKRKKKRRHHSSQHHQIPPLTTTTPSAANNHDPNFSNVKTNASDGTDGRPVADVTISPSTTFNEEDHRKKKRRKV